MSRVIVLDASGQRLSPCSSDKALLLLSEGKASLVASTPFTIQLSYTVPPIPVPSQERRLGQRTGEGKRLLLHICCGPCGTYTIQRLREQGYTVSGFWYNPNIHPFEEHERRGRCVRSYAHDLELPVIWWAEYEMPAFFRAVSGREVFGERCQVCYRMRLERTVQVARERSFDAFTTTLLISPYQQQGAIRQIGEELDRQYGIEFHYENFRRGWSERGRLAKKHMMYQQRYCGCVYSEWEARDRRASTRLPPPPTQQ